MSPRFDGSPEFGARDPLDITIVRPPSTWLQRVAARLRTHAAFGLAPVLAPTLLFVPLGYLLGPPGLNLLTASVLEHLTPAVSIALATLGIFVGMALGRRPHWDRRLFLAATFEATVTIVIVTAAVLILVRAWQLPLGYPASLIALALGVSASASSAVTSRVPGSARAVASRIADLDDVLPIVVGALVVGALREQTVSEALRIAGLTVLVGLTVGAIGWLLIEQAHSTAERGVFVFGSLALAGGASAYLAVSPLLAGLAAGMFWNWSPGRTDAIVREDVAKYQHPLVVLTLLAAGASLEFSMAALWLCAPFVLFRLAGKLLGGWLASKFTPQLVAADLGAFLMAPGLLGIAFAFTVQQNLAALEGRAVLTAVVVGTLVSEGIALLVTPAEGDA
jgi:hypothetical protein